MTTRNLWFIDSRVQDVGRITAGLSADTVWMLLSAQSDGIEQIKNATSAYTDLDSIHIVSHGSVANLYLGNTTLNDSNLTVYANDLNLIGSRLSINGDILLYGCDVGATDRGQEFVSALSKLTGADVAASSDKTGSLGTANWNLEIASGSIETVSLKAQDYETTLGTYTGTANNDSLTGTSGADSMSGGDGNDTLSGAAGNDTLDGGADTYGDWTDYRSATSSVTVNLKLGTASDGLGGTDTLSNIENVFGSAYNDVLTGNLRANKFKPGAGNDTVDGVDNSYLDDSVDYGDASSAVIVNLQTGTATGGSGNDVLISIEGVSGSTYDDAITLGDSGWAYGDAGNDTLVGGKRDSWLEGGAGNDVLKGGESSWDLASYYMGSANLDNVTLSGNATSGWTFSVGSQALLKIQANTANGNWTVADQRTGTILGTDTLTGIEVIEIEGVNTSGASTWKYLGIGGTQSAPTLNFKSQTGTSASDTLNGSSYADTLSGGDGDDSLNGGGSDDTLRGGAGNDTLNGSEQRNVAWKWARYYAGSDYDTADYSDVTAGSIKLDLSTMKVTSLNGSNVGTDTLRGIEAVQGTRQSDQVVGSFAALSGLGEADGEQHGVDLFLYGGSDTVTVSKVSNMPWIDSPYMGYWWSKTAVTANFSGSVGTISYGAATGQVAGTDTTDGVASFGDSAYSDKFDFSGMTSNFQTGEDWNYIYLNQGGNDTIVGNGDTQVAYSTSKELLSTTGLGINVHLAAAGTTFTVDMTHLSRTSSWQFGTVTLSNIDNINGTNLADTLVGGAYDNWEGFTGRGGNDSIDGGAGEDRASYWGASSAVTVNLAAGTASGDESIGTDTLRSIESIMGTQYDDVYDARGFSDTSTNAGSLGSWNMFDGRGGNDTIYGNGHTMINYWSSILAVEVKLGTGKAWALNASDRTGEKSGYVGIDTFSDVYRVRGSALGDSLVGGGQGWLNGDTRMEYFDPGAGNDTVDGLGGWDIVRYAHSTAAITVDLRLGSDQVQDGMGGSDTLLNVEGVQGSQYNDSMTGTDSNLGYGSQESFRGGAGNDTINGGGGFDWVEYSDDPTGAVTVNLSSGTASDGWDGTDTLSNIEGVVGSWKNDAITGSDGDNRLNGRLGEDTLDGGSGTDWAEYTFASGAVQVDLAAGTARGADGNDTLISIENAKGSIYDDSLVGSAGANKLLGSLGKDSLNGGDGVDTLDGGEGSDMLTGGAGIDTFILRNGGGGNTLGEADAITDFTDGVDAFSVDGALNFSDLLFYQGDGINAASTDTIIKTLGGEYLAVIKNFQAANINYLDFINLSTQPQALAGTSGNDILIGGSANDTIFGGAGSDTLVGADGNDSVVGGAGNDLIIGGDGAGDDTYAGGDGIDTVKYTSATAAIVVDLAASSNQAHSVSADNAGIGVDQLSGIENVIAGNYDDTLSGDSKDNTFTGGAGNDTLSGGSGSDTAVYSGARSNYTITTTAGGLSVQDNRSDGDGTDLIAGIEWLKFSDITVNLTGLNLIGSAFANRLSGDAGNDTLYGAGGIDVLDGKDGSDLYLMGAGDHPAAEIKDTGASGVDELRFISTTAATLTLFAGDTGIEKVVMGTGSLSTAITSGKAALNVDAGAVLNSLTIVGNDGANSIKGTSQADTISGGAGNDTLSGGAGADNLDGGLGDDSYVIDDAGDQVTEAVNAGTDLVQSSVSYALGAYLEKLTLTGAAAINGTGNSLANTITGNAGANSLDGGDGNDTLMGGDGQDSLTGGAGSDVFKLSSAASQNMDTILDFVSGEDKIYLSKAAFAKVGLSGGLKANAFYSDSNATAGHDADDRIIYNNATGALYYDADGSGSVAAV